MTDDPVNLDERRAKSARKAIEARRQRVEERHAHQAAKQLRQDELERLLMAGQAKTVPDAIAKARYLLQLFAATNEGREPRRRELIALALEDLSRLPELAKENS